MCNDTNENKWALLAENGKRASGLVKVIANVITDELLGVHILGPYSSEMIWGASVLIANKAKLKT